MRDVGDPSFHLPELLMRHRTRECAIDSGAECHGYAALDALANRCARFFDSIALEPGARVSFLAGNDPLVVAMYLGAWRSARIANPLNHRLAPRELAWILGHADPGLLVVSAEHLELAAQALAASPVAPPVLALRTEGALPLPTRGFDDVLAASDAPLRRRAPEPDDDALLLYTSGTTGHPKGVLLTHANVAWGADIVRRAFEIAPGERALCVMPIFHTNGLMFSTLPFLLAGATVILRPRFSARGFWRECREHGATNASVSPAILALLLEHAASAPPARDIRLDYVKVASAPTPAALAERFEARFGGGLLLETFGLTETTAITCMNPLRGERKRGSIGRPIPPQEARVVDAAGRPLAAGEVGEIVVRGPTVMREYFRDPDATKKTIAADGWLRTGDLARVDPDGYFFIVGRGSDMIVRGGENVSPLEVEAVAGAHPAVREAAAVGLPDPIWGEVVALCVVARSALGEEELRAFCRERLAAFKVPQRVAFVDELPRNAMGKVVRARMREVFWE